MKPKCRLSTIHMLSQKSIKLMVKAVRKGISSEPGCSRPNDGALLTHPFLSAFNNDFPRFETSLLGFEEEAAF